MHPSPSWEAASWASTQEYPNILWNGRFIIHKDLPQVRILNKINPIRATTPYLCNICFNPLTYV
jgi:hypothetical protein